MSPPRSGDFVELSSGQSGLLLSATAGRLEVLTDSGIVRTRSSARRIEGNAWVGDSRGQRICIGDTVRHSGKEARVVATYGVRVYTEARGDYESLPGQEVTLIDPFGTVGKSVIGKFVRKILPRALQRYSDPFLIVEVSGQGWLKGHDGQ
jgi:hypothetical protein